MQKTIRRCAILVAAIAAALLTSTVTAETSAVVAGATTRPIDITKDKTLYVIGYSHLDTQWRWAYPQVIREYIANTLHDNFKLIEKYPHYIFNFSGSRRYQMMKEYYPAEYEQLKKYVAAGRWFPCGSSVDEGDCNVPAAESLVRQMLYGNQYFRREFGVESAEFMLPDCFGFTAALPSIEAHCGLRGFSTQKLTWGSAVGIPFGVGVWNGPDGQGVIAALDPGAYSAKVAEDLSKSESWLTRIDNTGKKAGVYVDYHYYGTGDRGGAPSEGSVQWIEKAVDGNGPVRVVSSTAERMFKDIDDAHRANLPKYQGEFLLTQHSAGSVTSQGYMKRWNRKNELLADAAERASVAAMWLGDAPYPAKKLYDAWMLLLGSQMHDMLPGTSIPRAYEFCWSDELLAANQFAAVAQDAVGAVAKQMDTRAAGVPIVVYNPLSIAREDVVEAAVTFADKTPQRLTVFGPEGEVPSQVIERNGNTAKILFLAKAPSVGFVIYSVQAAAADTSPLSELKSTDHSIENARFKVTLNNAGDISSVFDKQNHREVFESPSRLAFLYENPSQFPAWNMDWEDRKNPPRSYVTGPATVKIVESGPVRATLQVSRDSEGSHIVQRISLAAGAAGDRVEVRNTIDWQTQQRSFKATFPLTVSNPNATYDIAVGTVSRGNNEPKKYEVPQHQWLDLTSIDGSYGAAILNDCKYGSDKPDDHTVRLTLLYTPGTRAGFHDQATQDIGRHDMTYAIAPHAGDWRTGNVEWTAARLNQPLMSFQARPHEGPLGKSFSLIKLNSDQVMLQAIKKAEDSDEVVIRLKELTGKPAENVRLEMASQIESAREVTGQEKDLAAAKTDIGALVTNLGPYRLRAFALKLAHAPTKSSPPLVHSIPLTYDTDAMSFPSNTADGAYDSEGRTYPADQILPKIISDGIDFTMGPTADTRKNAVTCRGQSINLAAGYNRVYLLASSSGADQSATFTLGTHSIPQTIQSWSGFIGQWDDRLWKGDIPESSYTLETGVRGLVPGYVKPAEVAWFCSHRHLPNQGTGFYEYSYLFKYGFDIPPGVTSIALPKNDKVHVFAISIARETHDGIVAARPLSDTLADHANLPAPSISPAGGTFSDTIRVTLHHPLYWTDSGLHYTTDGSEPSAKSPVYSAPIALSKSATIRAREFDSTGNPGPKAAATFHITDTAPPHITAAIAMSVLPTITVAFSEPLDKTSAENIDNFRLDPALPIRAAELSGDGQTVVLKLGAPISGSRSYRLSVHSVSDTSPSANAVSNEPVAVIIVKPVYHIAAVSCPAQSIDEPISSLPIHPGQPWTMNLFVRIENQPGNRTLIAGFGRSDNDAEGTGRYFAKFANGIHFWSRSRDVDANSPLDQSGWQMLTAIYDGQTLRLFKNAKEIGHRDIDLSDDDSAVHIAPIDPWDKQRRFEGEIRDFTIWNTMLPLNSIDALLSGKPPEKE
jgi:alpha-mannosidase